MNVIYRYIFVFVDRLIKMRHLIFIVIMKIKETTQTFYVYVWKHHDLFQFFLFDRDTQFIFDVWRHFCQMLRIDIKYFIAYHFEINEQTKRFNVIMKYYFHAFVNYIQNDWVKWLFDVEFAINNAFSIIIFVLLFLINSNQNSRLEFESFEFLITNIIVQQKIKLIDVENFIKKMKNFIVHFKEKILIIQIIYEFNVNRSRRLYSRYLVENEIWLNVNQIEWSSCKIFQNQTRFQEFFRYRVKFSRVHENSFCFSRHFFESCD